MVDDMRKNLDDAKAPTDDDRVSDESKEFSQDTNVSLHSGRTLISYLILTLKHDEQLYVNELKVESMVISLV